MEQKAPGLWNAYLNYLGIRYVNWPAFFILFIVFAALHYSGILPLIFSFAALPVITYAAETIIFLLLLPIILLLLRVIAESALKRNFSAIPDEFLNEPAGYKESVEGMRKKAVLLNTFVFFISVYLTFWILLEIVKFDLLMFAVLLIVLLPPILMQFIISFLLLVAGWGIMTSLQGWSAMVRPLSPGLSAKISNLERFLGLGFGLAKNERFNAFYEENLQYFEEVFSSHGPNKGAVFGRLKNSNIAVSLRYIESQTRKRKGGSYEYLVDRKLVSESFSPAPRGLSGYIRADKGAAYTGILFYDEYPYIFSKSLKPVYSAMKKSIDSFMEKNNANFVEIRFFPEGVKIEVHHSGHIKPSGLGGYLNDLKTLYEEVDKAVSGSA